MKKNAFLLTVFLPFCLGSCYSSQDMIAVKVSDELVSTVYIGNGVEWDPYDEAERWGASVSEADWQKLFKRIDFMRPGYVRCMINSPYRYYDSQKNSYDKNRNIESISKLLKYCTERNITVMYGEYNPPKWSMKEDQKWIDMSVDYLNYLVNDLGFDCIKYFVIFNEPDGNWASTDGNYKLWKSVLLRFDKKMREYPNLYKKVKFAAPDVVADYKNSNSDIGDAKAWVKMTANELDSLVGIYDIHSYPGQHEVRNGNYFETLLQHKKDVPVNKKIVLGEAGYKYWRTADSLLMKEYNRRLINHPFTKGSDCNMLVYDFFYGLDMPLLCMEVMNAGYSGIAAWMLDDAMHSNGDAGNTKDIKLWGMWNILGDEVFNDPSQEEIRPWYYTWSLMCRYFPSGADILKTNFDRSKKVYVASARKSNKYTVSMVNVNDKPVKLSINFPEKLQNVKMYIYEEGNRKVNQDGLPLPVQTDIKINSGYAIVLQPQSFVLLTNMD
ncbi:hypothetical protein MASR2M117_21970 [Paludibacter sp.]